MAKVNDFKAILIDNKSALPVTLFLYKNWNKRRFFSICKIVEPGESFFLLKEEAFRFELGARYDGKKMETFFPLRKCEEELVLRIRGDDELKVTEERLQPEEKQNKMYLRRQNMNDEVSASGSKNLYEILGLNMQEVRSKTFTEQNHVIKKAYRSQLRRWDPDKNPENGDNAICQVIIFAYKILRDPEARAAYHNIADFDKGWLSRWKAVFNTECYSDEQKKQYRKRMGLLFLSSLLTAAGFGLTFLTAVMTAGVFAIKAVSGVFVGGGISSGLRTMSRDSVQNGCTFKQYCISLGFGAVSGLAWNTGVAEIAGVLGGAAKTAIEAAQHSLGRRIVVKMANNVFHGLVDSIVKTLDETIARGGKPTGQQFLLVVSTSALLGGIAGASGELAENMIEGAMSFEAMVTISGDGVDTLTSITVERFSTTVFELLNGDADIQCKCPADHARNAEEQAIAAIECYCVQSGVKVLTNSNSSTPENAAPVADHNCLMHHKIKLQYFCEGKWFSKMLVDYEENGEQKHNEGKDSGSLIWISNNATNIEVSFKVMRGPGVWCDVKKYDRFNKRWVEPIQPHIFKYDTPVSCTYTLAGRLYYEAVTKVSTDNFNVNYLRSYEDLIAETDYESTSSDIHGLNYISEGSWFSKMLVEYEENGEIKLHEGHGSESSICLPNNATNIEVRFQVMRAPGIWSDVKKYDRFKKSWIKPTESHIFNYDRPVSRTYTLAGGLYYEAVIKITGTRDDDDIQEI